MERAKALIQARKTAEALIKAIGRHVAGDGDALTGFATETHPEFDETRMWEMLAEGAAAKCGFVVSRADEPGAAMSMAESLDFERETIPKGTHAGSIVKEIEPSYWIGVWESCFAKKLMRYMKSVRFSQRQRG